MFCNKRFAYNLYGNTFLVSTGGSQNFFRSKDRFENTYKLAPDFKVTESGETSYFTILKLIIVLDVISNIEYAQQQHLDHI